MNISMLMNPQVILLLLVHLVLGIFIGHFILQHDYSYTSPFTLFKSSKTQTDNPFQLSSNVHSVNLSEPINGNFTCMRTKTLLNYITPHICLHEARKDIYVSRSFSNVSIWEEEGVTHILRLLLRHPHLDFIDIGANIGTYTMYAAALGRFVLAIECFGPNINRIHRAVQLSNVANRVVLIQNALFTHSGQFLRLSDDAVNIGGQELEASTNRTHNQSTTSNPYIVKTITFDELVPILLARGIRGAIMKIDIEGSESFVVESGSQIFDRFDIPFIQMEWLKVRHHASRVQVILDFFAKRNYDPRTLSCQFLVPAQHVTWPGDICWIKRHVSSFC
jgi:FkbM family methyltransferase